MGAVTSNLDVYRSGLLVTVELACWVFALAATLGVLLAVCRICPVPPLRWAAGLHVAVFRSVPLLVLLTVFVFGLPEVGLLYPLFWTAVTAMSLYWSAFFSEAVRSGIRSVPLGQVEAARALGLRTGQCLRAVVLPQALRAMVQPLANLLIAVVLSSSLAAAVGVTTELTGQTELLDQQYAEPLLTYGAAAVCYVALTLGIGRLAGFADRKARVHTS
jgi:glutamate transport system permease protein